MDPSKYMIDWLIDLSRVGRLGRVKDGEGEMSSRLRRRLRADAWSRWLWHLHNMLTKYLQVQMLYRSPCTFNPKIQSAAQRHFLGQDKPKRTFLGPKLFFEQRTIMVTMINDYGDENMVFALYSRTSVPIGSLAKTVKSSPSESLKWGILLLLRDGERREGRHTLGPLSAVSNCTNHLAQHKVVNG